jgi:endonuclease G
MNPERRMAWFTACNINGESWVNIDRDTGEPKESAEGKETWFVDPRLAPEHQLFQGYFDKTSVYFDRGHLVRRQDPTWGSDTKAVRANADTYHFTNCSPQNWTFNQKTKYWQGVEIHLLEHGAVLDVDRLTVFTGPVFTADDPTVTQHKAIKVPLRYWKVAARVQGGKLRASGFVVDQSDIFKTKRETPKPATINKLVKEWRVAIHDIENQTGLSFGDVTDRDTFTGPESAAPREIRDWSDLE